MRPVFDTRLTRRAWCTEIFHQAREEAQLPDRCCHPWGQARSGPFLLLNRYPPSTGSGVPFHVHLVDLCRSGQSKDNGIRHQSEAVVAQMSDFGDGESHATAIQALTAFAPYVRKSLIRQLPKNDWTQSTGRRILKSRDSLMIQHSPTLTYQRRAKKKFQKSKFSVSSKW